LNQPSAAANHFHALGASLLLLLLVAHFSFSIFHFLPPGAVTKVCGTVLLVVFTPRRLGHTPVELLHTRGEGFNGGTNRFFCFLIYFFWNFIYLFLFII
jgi:hypothetical protein